MSYNDKDASTNPRRVSLTAEEDTNTFIPEEEDDLYNDNSSFISEMLPILNKNTQRASRAANSSTSRPGQPTHTTDGPSNFFGSIYNSNALNQQQDLADPGPLNPFPLSIPAQTIPSLERHHVLADREFASGPQPMISQAMYDAATFSDSSSADNLGYISGQSPFDGQASSSFNNYPPLNSGSAYFTGYGTTPGSPQAFNPYNAQLPRDQRNRGGRFKTTPEEAWVAHERRQSQQFQLDVSELEVGLIVYNSPDDSWAGGHSVLILGWEDLDHVDFLETTTFTNRRITQVFPDENDERRQDFLLVTDSRVAPHSGLPTVDLEGGMAMPRVSYIKFRVKRMGKFSNFRRFADRKSLDNRYVVTRDGMDIVRDYLVKREGHMKEYAAKEKQEQEEKKAEAAESAKALEEQQKKVAEAAEKAEAEWLAAEEESRRVTEEEKKAMEETKKRKAEEMKMAVLEQIALMKVDRA